MIEKKWEKIVADYIKKYNISEKYAKIVWKVLNRYNWNKTRNLEIYKVV